MTNHWIDLKNTDVALIIGSNAAENHPMSFKWLMEAREKRGAKIISVDPRFTRTSAQADLYAPMRSGTDIPFIAGLIKYAIDNNLIHHDYVVNYTNVSFLIHEGYDFKDGLFSGYDPARRSYTDRSTWNYQTDEDGKPLRDETLQHPNTVFQLMKKHYARYDVDTVCSVVGTPKEDFLKVAEVFCGTGQPGKSGTIMYAMGTTQHTVGSQNVKAYAMLQLLLGNVGIAGGGVNALRGECNVQGSTDIGLLNNILPGYNPTPTATAGTATLADYVRTQTPAGGFWVNRPKFLVSQLKAYWGSAATKENDFAYDYLPKRRPVDHTQIAMYEEMYQGVIKGLLCVGQNPMVANPNVNKIRSALGKLDWMVVVDPFECETAAFWKSPGYSPADYDTEVFLLPPAIALEKEGTFTDSGRRIQYLWKTADSPGETRSDYWIFHQLARRLKAVYANSNKDQDAPIRELFWNYGDGDMPDIDAIMREISGYDVETSEQLNLFGALADDGTTLSGCWIYCGMYSPAGNLTKRRSLSDPGGYGNYLQWGYAWPANRRVLYNRAAADANGKPYAEDKKGIWWDGAAGRWTGYDVPDFGVANGPDTPAWLNPFIMRVDGKGGLFSVLNEGPFPEHYEPWESPVPNLFNKQPFNPATIVWEGDMNKRGSADQFPYVATSYRLSEHYQGGAMTRNNDWLVELMPNMFVEISESLAAAKGIKNGGKVKVSSARGEIEAYAIVTSRMKPLNVQGQKLETVGMVWHYGFQGLAKGGTANELTPNVGDANTTIPEYKAFLCDIRRAD
jgi:formate dehydrogenase major subunit